MKQPNSFMNQISLNVNQCILDSFLEDQFLNIQTFNDIDMLTFRNYLSLPFFLTQKIYNTFNQSKTPNLTKEDFMKGMRELYSENYLTRLKCVFSFLDFYNVQKINKADVKLFLQQFHYITNQSDVKDLMEKVDEMFDTNSDLSFDEVVDSCRFITNDVMGLICWFCYHYLPIHRESIEFYRDEGFCENDNKNIMMIEERRQMKNKTQTTTFTDEDKEDNDDGDNNKKNDNENKMENYKRNRMKTETVPVKKTCFYEYKDKKDDDNKYKEPSAFVFDYIDMNFNEKKEKQYNIKPTVSKQEPDQSIQEEEINSNIDPDLEELLAFEDNVIQLKSQLVNDENNNRNSSFIPIKPKRKSDQNLFSLHPEKGHTFLRLPKRFFSSKSSHNEVNTTILSESQNNHKSCSSLFIITPSFPNNSLLNYDCRFIDIYSNNHWTP